MRAYGACLFILTTPLAARAAVSVVTTRVESGLVAGHSNGFIDVYKGVPFAAAPVGPLRWKPPQPAPPWKGAREAFDNGPACPQPINKDGRTNGGGYVGPVSEDCLNLNIFAPAHLHGAPVMVWIFGGGNVYGANAVPSNDGTSFARDGVVLVSINYRLGALGYFAHPALTRAAAPGEPLASYGVMDQIAALAWIKRNIKAFGGDPKNVTIFGESAGGSNVLTLMATPAAKDLFQKAAVQSGGGWETQAILADAETAGVALAAKLGLPADASADQLRALPVESLVGAPGRFGPVIDGRLLKETSTQAFARGDEAHVPLIIGSNSFEASLMPPGAAAAAAYLARTPAETKAAYAGEALDDESLARVVFGDAFMGGPARWIAAQASAKAPAWLYYFSYVRVVRRGKIPGANHTSEIPYVFDSQMVIPNYAAEIMDEDRAMAARVHSCWVAFAKAGAPKCAGGPEWPVYLPASDQLMEFGLTPALRQHFRKPQLDAAERQQGTLLSGN
jgi:para-nitrobenzyl esterase